jgi:tol-pal system protein YbgF
MTKRTLRALAALALPLSLCVASPAAAQNREHQQMAAELRMLQEQSQQLAITLSTLNQALAESIKTLNARLEDSNNTLKKAFADQKLLIDNMARDVGVARERAGDTNVRITSLQEEVEALRATVQAFQQAAAAAAAVAAPVDPNAPIDPNAPAPVAPAPSAPVPSAAGLSPTRLWETARADFFAGQWDSAISGFQAFLKTFPKSELADDAQFNIGETYYSQNKWAEAVAEYDKVIDGYPSTNSVPLAYYKRGMSQERLGQTDAARASWETVVKMAPDSDAGRLAKQLLSRAPAQPR